MSEFFADVRVQEVMLLLIISFTIALFLCGLFIFKRRVFDKKEKSNIKTGAEPRSPSRIIGAGMMFAGSVLAFVAILMLILSLVTN